MKGFFSAVSAEFLKVSRSKVPFVSAIAFCLGPVFSVLFMVVLTNPDLARNMAALSGKLGANPHADWQTHFSMVLQAIAVGGFLVSGFITAWIFGREHADKTAKDFLALPISRTAVMSAKLFIAIMTSFAATIVVAVVAVLGGLLIGLQGSLSGSIGPWLLSSLGTFGLIVLLLPSIAFAASAGRGYLPALGAVAVATILAQIIAALGAGAYFPWAIPALAIGMAGDQVPLPASYAILAAVAIGGVLGTFIWWKNADQR